MPDPRRRKCKDCGRSDIEAGGLSWNGLCMDCGQGRVRLNNTQLRNGRGPMHDTWKTKTLAGLGVALVDAPSDDA